MEKERKPYDKLINTQLFEISSPEIYNKVIPKYFTQPAKSDLPMLNGVRVSWEEYLEARPDAERPPEFVPDMIYDPYEMNQATSSEPVAAMIDLLDNNIDFSIAHPGEAYPQIIEILEGYIDLAQYYMNNNPTLKAYLPKVVEALNTFNRCYTNYQNRIIFRTTGSVETVEDEFSRIEKRFL